MNQIGILTLLLSLSFLGGCKNTQNITDDQPKAPTTTGSIEINKFEVIGTSAEIGSIEGVILDENGEGIAFMNVTIDSLSNFSTSDVDSRFKLENIPAGKHTIRFEQIGMISTVSFQIEEGQQLELNVSIALFGDVQLLKPIIYLYPEEKTEVEVELIYEGEITTTYPKYPTNGWKVTASPDGTLIDENDKEYYALYWEGNPRKPLGIDAGFVVSKEETIPFLEEKLAFLGLNPKESNEFIIFWLPILEKNAFNVIRFAEDDYLKQAELNITPKPETVIRIAMVFKGLDEEIDIQMQDLTPLKRTRKGFTVVEWGGQELPKSFKLGI